MTSLIIITILFDFALAIILSIVLGLLCCYFVELIADLTYNIIYRINIKRFNRKIK